MTLCFRYETCHQPVGDSGAYPDFYQHIVGVFIVDLKKLEIVVVEHGNKRIEDEDGPEIALGVALPVLASIEVGERAEQEHRQCKAHQVQGVADQGRLIEDVAQ